MFLKLALDFSQEAYASLASFVFTVFFATFSLVAGGISDRYPRNWIALLGCGIWSFATAAESLVTSYSQIVPLRAIVGASQAFYNPAAYTLLADIFPERLIARVNGIFTSGIYLGGGYVRSDKNKQTGESACPPSERARIRTQNKTNI